MPAFVTNSCNFYSWTTIRYRWQFTSPPAGSKLDSLNTFSFSCTIGSMPL